MKKIYEMYRHMDDGPDGYIVAESEYDALSSDWYEYGGENASAYELSEEEVQDRYEEIMSTEPSKRDSLDEDFLLAYEEYKKQFEK